MRLDDHPQGGAPGTPFSRSRPIVVRTLQVMATQGGIGENLEVWLAPQGVAPTSRDGRAMTWPAPGGPGGGALAVRVLKPRWQKTTMRVAGSGPDGVDTAVVLTAEMDHATTVALADGTVRAWLRAGDQELALLQGFANLVVLAWLVEEL